jgi:8-oxo-dGTP diphosphatase
MQKVLAAIVEKEGRILIAKRKKGDYFEGRWEFPGGKLIPGETPEEGLKREMREEFGVEVQVGDFLASVPYRSTFLSIELLAFRIRQVRGSFRLLDHAAIRWASLAELETCSMTEPDMLLLQELKKLKPQKLA